MTAAILYLDKRRREKLNAVSIPALRQTLAEANKRLSAAETEIARLKKHMVRDNESPGP